MANYAKFPTDSFAARARKVQATGLAAAPRSPVADADYGDYGSLLVVRVGRPKKKPVLMLDPAEAAAEAAQFQQVAAENFANPQAFERRCAIVRLSALAANETGLEDYEAPAATTPDADAALALWSNPVEPIDTSDWCDAPADELYVAETEAVDASSEPVFEPFFVAADVVEEQAAEAMTPAIEPDDAAEIEPVQAGLIARLRSMIAAAFDKMRGFRLH